MNLVRQDDLRVAIKVFFFFCTDLRNDEELMKNKSKLLIWVSCLLRAREVWTGFLGILEKRVTMWVLDLSSLPRSYPPAKLRWFVVIIGSPMVMTGDKMNRRESKSVLIRTQLSWVAVKALGLWRIPEGSYKPWIPQVTPGHAAWEALTVCLSMRQMFAIEGAWGGSAERGGDCLHLFTESPGGFKKAVVFRWFLSSSLSHEPAFKWICMYTAGSWTFRSQTVGVLCWVGQLKKEGHPEMEFRLSVAWRDNFKVPCLERPHWSVFIDCYTKVVLG